MKINKLTLILLAFVALLPQAKLQAQDSTSHKFTDLMIEIRAAFDVDWENHACYDAFSNQRIPMDDTTTYGFNGHYFNLKLGGEFGKGFSYYFRQRIIANKGAASLFDNTDFLYLQYQFHPRWAVRVGKEALAIGGYEYDAAPIDVYFYTNFWGNVHCFQLAGSLIYTDLKHKNKLTLQVANSPYVYYNGDGNEWKQGLLGYSLMWNGNFNHFQTIYSINFFERKRGDFISYISLGNKLQFGWWSWYVDYMNRAANVKKFFSDFMLVSRMDFSLKNVNLYVKAGYEQNFAENPYSAIVRDPLMTPNASAVFYGLGVEYHPKGIQAVRLHAFVKNNHFTVREPRFTDSKFAVSGEIGVTWNVDFLRYFSKKLNSTNN